MIRPDANKLVQFRDKNGSDWEVSVKQLPDGFRHVATVDRPNGDIEDLGQNAEGKFALFRRLDDPFSFYSHGKMQRLSDEDILGFGLLRAVCVESGDMEDDGMFSSLCKTQLVKSDLSSPAIFVPTF